jgi:hypothetical protein
VAGYLVLRTILEAHQRARQARERVDRDGEATQSADGQIKAHPLLAAERDACAVWSAGVKLLGLKMQP